jgi:hypothetical protein
MLHVVNLFSFQIQSLTNFIMKQELTSAANLIVHFLRVQQKNISEYTLELFTYLIIIELTEKFSRYWLPEEPYKHSHYRIIQFERHGHIDSHISEAGRKCGFSETFLKENLSPLKIWIDPNEVSYIYKDNRRRKIIYNQDSLEPWTPFPISATAFSISFLPSFPEKNPPFLKKLNHYSVYKI